MPKKNSRFRSLLRSVFARYLTGKSSTVEQNFVNRFYESIGDDKQHDDDLEEIGQDIKTEIDKRIHRRELVRAIQYSRYATAAACVLMTFTILGTLIYQRDTSLYDTACIDQVAHKNPFLSIGNAHVYDLVDSVPSGSTYQWINEEKVLDLSALKSRNGNEVIRIENPSQKTFSVLLRDGSQAWLKQYASIEFDSDFGNNIRRVQVAGEVLFDVKKSVEAHRKIPFFVNTSMQTITVLGTKFNVDAKHEEEESVELFEGSIQLQHNVHSTQIRMKPGEQAFLNREQVKIYVSATKNSKKADAWRRGLFHFEDEKLGSVMEELGQWYEREIEVSKAIADLPITGMVTRYDNVKEVLQIIELTNNINYVEKKGKIYVNKKL
jgi:transmembrane sensor